MSQQPGDKDRQAKLLPCPFCGGAARFGTGAKEGVTGGHFIECNGCWASTTLVFAVKDDVTRELTERWNARAVRPELQPIRGAYRWIEAASAILKAKHGESIWHPGEWEKVDELLAGVPTPNKDLGFDSPADRAAVSTSGALTDWLRDNAPDCGDNSCLFGGRGKGGMRTNGGCRCMSDLPQKQRRYVERMQSALTPASATQERK